MIFFLFLVKEKLSKTVKFLADRNNVAEENSALFFYGNGPIPLFVNRLFSGELSRKKRQNPLEIFIQLYNVVRKDN